MAGDDLVGLELGQGGALAFDGGVELGRGPVVGKDSRTTVCRAAGQAERSRAIEDGVALRGEQGWRRLRWRRSGFWHGWGSFQG